jgi:hypothetical protein
VCTLLQAAGNKQASEAGCCRWWHISRK